MRIFCLFAFLFAMGCQNNATSTSNSGAKASPMDIAPAFEKTDAQVRDFVLEVTRAYSHWETAYKYMRIMANEADVSKKANLEKILGEYSAHGETMLQINADASQITTDWEGKKQAYGDVLATLRNEKTVQVPRDQAIAMERAVAEIDTRIKNIHRQIEELQINIGKTKAKFDELTLPQK